MPERPNVLFLMDDEHRFDTLGYAGDDLVRTPNLDRLAEDACIFENAYTPSPRCVPARQCLSAGQLPMTCGCLGWGAGLDADQDSYARRFTEYGYRTASAGKSHYKGESAFRGFQTMLGSVETDEAIDLKVQTEFPRNKWSDAKQVKRAGVGHTSTVAKDELTLQAATYYIQDNFLDTFYDRAHPDRETFLKVSFSQPHYPFIAGEKETFEYYLNRVEPFIEAAPDHDGLSAREVTVGDDGHGFMADVEDPADVTEREVRRATAAYYAMIESVDRMYGELLDTLERAGETLDEWIIVFCSDHGEMLGEHGVWEKGSFYEASAGVPLMVRWPERFEGKRIEANVNLIDLYATLCELADLPVQDSEAPDSRSLVPLLEGDTESWHEQYPNDEVVSAEDDRLMVKRGDLKYIHFPEASFDGGDVLFDLSEDPGERQNLVNDPAYAADVSAFEARTAELGYGPAADPDYQNAGYH